MKENPTGMCTSSCAHEKQADETGKWCDGRTRMQTLLLPTYANDTCGFDWETSQVCYYWLHGPSLCIPSQFLGTDCCKGIIQPNETLRRTNCISRHAARLENNWRYQSREALHCRRKWGVLGAKHRWRYNLCHVFNTFFGVETGGTLSRDRCAKLRGISPAKASQTSRPTANLSHGSFDTATSHTAASAKDGHY